MNTDIFAAQLIKTALEDGIQKLSVGAAFLHEGKLLILKRSAHDFMPNIYELPGGALEKDESLLQALERELLEETNCSIDKVIGYIGHIDFLSSSGLRTRRFNFLIQPKLPLSVQLTEHDDYQWIIPSAAVNYQITSKTRTMIAHVQKNDIHRF